MRRLSMLSALALGVVLLSAARLPAPPLPPKTATGLTALEKYLFDDVSLVGVANVKTALALPMYAKVKKEAAAVADHELFSKFIKPFGVKPLQDVERVVLVMGEQKVRERSFNEKRTENDERMYFLFQGKFDPKKFESGFAEIAKEHKEAKVLGKGETAILEVGNGNVFFSLLDKSTFIIAPSKKVVEEVQARASGKSKAKFKLSKDFPAALKSLKGDVAIDAVGFGTMQIDSKFESLGKDGYKLTPITLDEKGFKKFTVRVEGKDELKGQVTLEGKDKTDVADLARKMTSGLEEEIKRGERFAERDPLAKAMFQVLKGVKIKSAKQNVVMEGKLTQDDAKGLLEGMKKQLDMANSRGGPKQP